MTEPAKRPKMCAICGEARTLLASRGRKIICKECRAKAVDSTGRPIAFEDGFSKRGDLIIMNGPGAYYREPDPEAGQRAEEASTTRMCWIDGIQCELIEGAAGWQGLVLVETPQKKPPTIIEF